MDFFSVRKTKETPSSLWIWIRQINHVNAAINDPGREMALLLLCFFNRLLLSGGGERQQHRLRSQTLEVIRCRSAQLNEEWIKLEVEENWKFHQSWRGKYFSGSGVRVMSTIQRVKAFPAGTRGELRTCCTAASKTWRWCTKENKIHDHPGSKLHRGFANGLLALWASYCLYAHPA